MTTKPDNMMHTEVGPDELLILKWLFFCRGGERWEWMKVMKFSLDEEDGSLHPPENCTLRYTLRLASLYFSFSRKTSTQSNMTAQYPYGAVKSPLPDFRIGPYKTKSHALHDEAIMGRAIDWTSFETDAMFFCRQTEWNATKRVSVPTRP